MIKITAETDLIKKKQKKLSKILNVKIKIEGNEITLEGTGDNEYIAERVIDAINFGFSVPNALLIKEEDFIFEILDIKDYTPKKDLKRIRARIIGTNGKTLRTLLTLTDCHFEIKDNRVGIIGAPELMQNAQNAVISLTRGSKQGNVYAFLEKHRVKPIFDLGLKPIKKKKRPREDSNL